MSASEIVYQNNRQFIRIREAVAQAMADKQSALNKALFHAAKNNDAHAIQNLIRRGAVVDSEYGYGLQLLPNQDSLIVMIGYRHIDSASLR